MDYIRRHPIARHGRPYRGDMGFRKGTFALGLSISGVDDGCIFIPWHGKSCSVPVVFEDEV